MRKCLLVLLILLLLSSCSTNKVKGKINRNTDSTKTNTYVIEYDFEKGIYNENNLQLNVDMPTVFKIKNINRMAYNVTISSNDTILAETFMVDQLEKVLNESTSDKNKLLFQVNDFKIIPKSDISTLNPKEDFLDNDKSNSQFIVDIKNTQKINLMVAEKEKLTQILNQKNLKVDFFKSEIEKDNLKKASIEEIEKKLSAVVNSDTTVLDDVIKSKNKLVLDIASKNDSIKKNTIDADSIKIKIKMKSDSISIASDKINTFLKKYNQDNIAFQNAFYDLNEVYKAIMTLQDCFSDIKVIADYPYMNKSKYEKEYKTKCYEKAMLILLQKENLLKFKEYYNQVGIKYSILKYDPYLAEYLNYGGQNKVFAQADYLNELANKINSEVNNLNIAITLQKMQHLLSFLEDEKVYQYVSAPIQPTQDAAVFKIKIQKKTDNHSDITDEKSFKHTEYTFGGTRVDFSLGLAASKFENANVYEFGVRNDSTIISRKSKGLVTPSLVGLITMSYRRTQYASFGASAGLGIDVVNGKIQLSNFFVGPTILFGKYDRLFLTGGLSFRNVGQLKSGYQDGDVVTAGSDDINKYLSDKYAVGYFLSLTYNLTKGVRANYKRLK